MVKINASLSKEKRILKAAEQVFSHKGYTQATLDEIIQIADTGKGTVYKYYKNKENLFYTLVEAKNRKLMKAMETAVCGADLWGNPAAPEHFPESHRQAVSEASYRFAADEPEFLFQYFHAQQPGSLYQRKPGKGRGWHDRPVPVRTQRKNCRPVREAVFLWQNGGRPGVPPCGPDEYHIHGPVGAARRAARNPALSYRRWEEFSTSRILWATIILMASRPLPR